MGQYARKPAPGAVLIGMPGLPQGPARLTCQTCEEKYPVQLSTALTVTQLRCAGKDILVVCHGCMSTHAPQYLDLAMMEQIGNSETRARLGLDN